MATAMRPLLTLIVPAALWLPASALSGCLQVTIQIPLPSPQVAFRTPDDSWQTPSPRPAPLPAASTPPESPAPVRASEAAVSTASQYQMTNPSLNGFAYGPMANDWNAPVLRNGGVYPLSTGALMTTPGLTPYAWPQSAWPLGQAWPINALGAGYGYALGGPQVLMIPAPDPEITVVVPTPAPSPVIVIIIPTPTPTASTAN